MDLRPASLEDVPALSALGARAFAAAFGHLYDPADLSAFIEKVYAPVSVRADIEDSQRRIQLAVDAQGEVMAFCKIGLVTSYAQHARGTRPMDLMQLYCDPDRTSQGLGTRLTEWALETMRALGADEALLSVWSENHGAQRFYARHGFARIADIDFWVGNHRDDEFLLARAL